MMMIIIIREIRRNEEQEEQEEEEEVKEEEEQGKIEVFEKGFWEKKNPNPVKLQEVGYFLSLQQKQTELIKNQTPSQRKRKG